MNHNIKLPASFAPLTDAEKQNANGGFALTAPVAVLGAAVAAVGALGVNMFRWATGKSDSNFIQSSINAGKNFIDGSVNVGRNFLHKLMGISLL